MIGKLVRGSAAALLALAAVVAVAAPASAAPVRVKQEAVPQVRLADWYGTAYAIQTARNGGGYLLTHGAGNRPVVLEERSVTVRVIRRAGDSAPITRSTRWHRLATVGAPPALPAVGQWARSAGYNGKQFRLCRIGIPGKGKVCTAYSGVIVPV